MVAGLFDRLAAQWFLSERAGGFLVDNPHALEPDADEEMLLRRAAAGDAPAKSALVERYRGFAYSLTRKYLRSGTNREDMEQVAAIALVKALDRFDPDRGVKFTTFAAQTVDGELKRFIRDAGWSLRVPRGLQELGLEARQASAELSQRMGGEPTLKDVAAAVDKDVDEVGAALLARESFDAASLDAPAGGAEAPPLADALPDHDQRLVMAPEWSDLSLVLDDLPERERRILFLRFFKDLSQAEIAQIMGISQMHVSRLLARSIEDLRLWIGLTTERDG
jgi:RNA polymerase sigma-B factor